MMVLKVERVGGLLGIMLPYEVIASFQIEEGDLLSALQTEQGYLLTKCDPSTENKLKAARPCLFGFS